MSKQYRQIYSDSILKKIVSDEKPKDIYNLIPDWLKKQISENRPVSAISCKE